MDTQPAPDVDRGPRSSAEASKADTRGDAPNPIDADRPIEQPRPTNEVGDEGGSPGDSHAVTDEGRVSGNESDGMRRERGEGAENPPR